MHRRDVSTQVYSWAVVAFEVWSLRGKPFSTYSLEAHADKVVVAGERPRLPVACRMRYIGEIPYY